MSDSGGYEQFRLLGRSPHLLTYRARAERLGGDMVLRIYPVELGAEEPSQLFIDQMRRLANLRGRGLVTPIEVGHTDAGAPYVTRRYVDAPSLENLVPVRSNDLDAWTGQISWFGSRLCHTVAALHEIGSVHGSIRPSNIFVTAVGTLHVTDVVPRSAMTLGVHGIQRRPDHLAPEVLAGDLPDRDSDVYAIASVLRGLVGNEVITNLPTNLRMIFDEALDSRPGRRPPLEEMAGCFDRELGERGYEPARQTALPSAPQRVAIESSNHEPVAIGLASNGASAPDTEPRPRPRRRWCFPRRRVPVVRSCTCSDAS